MTVYGVRTKCGRFFAWSANDMDDLFRKMVRRGYEIVSIEFEEQIQERKEVIS